MEAAAEPMRSAYEQKQRRSDMEAAAEPMRRQEQAPPSPTANVNFPGPAAISDYSTVDGLQVYISMVSNKPFDRSVPPSPV